jgi:hypothetical protein
MNSILGSVLTSGCHLTANFTAAELDFAPKLDAMPTVSTDGFRRYRIRAKRPTG